MKIIIAGSRTITDKSLVFNIIYNSLTEFSKGYPEIREDLELISGGARGVDSLAKDYADNNKYRFKEFLADWDKYGKRAGYIRNVEMAANADALIAVWDGQSKGTKHMIDIATRRKLKVFIYRTDKEI